MRKETIKCDCCLDNVKETQPHILILDDYLYDICEVCYATLIKVFAGRGRLASTFGIVTQNVYNAPQTSPSYTTIQDIQQANQLGFQTVPGSAKELYYYQNDYLPTGPLKYSDGYGNMMNEKDTPAITWPKPAAIAYGEGVAAAQGNTNLMNAKPAPTNWFKEAN
jgi:hypothetical protein